MKKFQDKYRIPTARATWHDYNGGMYYITICTAGREHYFGEIRNGIMILNVLGEFVSENIRNVSIHNSYAEIPQFVVMPNHIHLIVCIDNNPVETWPATSEIDGGFVETWPATSDIGNMSDVRNTSDIGNMSDVRNTSDVGNAAGHDFIRDAAGHVSTDKMREIANQCGLLSTTIGGIKSAVTRYARTNGIRFGWQTRFHDRIIRDQNECNRIACYIENNVTIWENDKFHTK